MIFVNACAPASATVFKNIMSSNVRQREREQEQAREGQSVCVSNLILIWEKECGGGQEHRSYQ